MITPIEQLQKRQTGVKTQRGYGRTDVNLIKENQNSLLAHARIEMETIARAAGVEMHKTARIVMRRGHIRQQVDGLKVISQALQEIANAASRDDVHAQSGIATGYANAMLDFGLMSESELDDLIAVIGQAGESALRRIETTKPLFSTH